MLALPASLARVLPVLVPTRSVGQRLWRALTALRASGHAAIHAFPVHADLWSAALKACWKGGLWKLLAASLASVVDFLFSLLRILLADAITASGRVQLACCLQFLQNL